jgi:hypothetical protein
MTIVLIIFVATQCNRLGLDRICVKLFIAM